MTVENILKILKTRKETSKISGNTTEFYFVCELIKMAEDYKELKEQEE